MADSLSTAKVWLDQTLHGYAGGHRLIMGSAKLKEAEARIMLVLSDTSGGLSSNPEYGYLTAYPLLSASQYVLARTWPATEMSRPGCVWTHSILIGFADLATITGASDLLQLFRRPSSNTTGYDQPIALARSERASGSTKHPKAGSLISALYVEPVGKVEMKAQDPADDEELMLAVWLQQWPRLRRSFRFCSFAGSDRSNESGQFDLQAVGTASGPKRTIITGARAVEETILDPRLSDALDDLRHPNGLRTFLTKVGGDVRHGRSAMVALCQLHKALGHPPRETAISNALDAFEALGSGQARAARRMWVERALKDIDGIDERSLDFLLDSLKQDDAILEPYICVRLGAVLWRRSPVSYVESISSDSLLGRIVSTSLPSLQIEQIESAVVDYPEIALKIVSARPDVLTLSAFWKSLRLDLDLDPDIDFDLGTVFDLIDEGKQDGVLSAILDSGRSDIASPTIHKFGTTAVLAALEKLLLSDPVNDPSPWLRMLAREPANLGAPLSSGILSRNITVQIAKYLDPDAIPNYSGDDPWAIAARVPGNVSAEEENRFAAFLIARALGRQSRSCAELFRISFDLVHSALAADVMPSEGWQLIEHRLGWPKVWNKWDKCERVREAVTKKFIESELDPLTFGRNTEVESVFRSLAEIAAKTRSGRRYLEKVRKVLREEPDESMQARAKLLKKLI